METRASLDKIDNIPATLHIMLDLHASEEKYLRLEAITIIYIPMKRSDTERFDFFV